MPKLVIAAALTGLVTTPLFAGDCPSTCQASKCQSSDAVVHVSPAPVHYASHHGEADKPKDIVDTAASVKDFSTLVAAVKAAGLVDALRGDGPFTVFAPTNEAFEKLPEGTVENLLKPENKDQLTSILLYHVVPGKVLAADVVKLEKAETLLEEKSVTINVEDGKVFVNKAQVVKTDIETSNGVIHIIDSVILP